MPPGARERLASLFLGSVGILIVAAVVQAALLIFSIDWLEQSSPQPLSGGAVGLAGGAVGIAAVANWLRSGNRSGWPRRWVLVAGSLGGVLGMYFASLLGLAPQPPSCPWFSLCFGSAFLVGLGWAYLFPLALLSGIAAAVAVQRSGPIARDRWRAAVTGFPMFALGFQTVVSVWMVLVAIYVAVQA